LQRVGQEDADQHAMPGLVALVRRFRHRDRHDAGRRRVPVGDAANGCALELRIEERRILVVGGRARQALVAGDIFVVRPEHEVINGVVLVRAQHFDRLRRQVELDRSTRPRAQLRRRGQGFVDQRLVEGRAQRHHAGRVVEHDADCQQQRERSDQDQQQAAADRHAARTLRRSAIHATDSSSR
jgi:hypothetical protein